WTYSGWRITESSIHPQKLTIHTDIRTLHNAQKLMGDLQWLRPVVGFPNEWLNKLRPLLRGTNPAQS
ncbi:POK18 protein, partial [Corvus moneduloides]|nr:POK18 protein [Corvus moneduloides]